jgi:hypothetical protein
MRDFAALFFLLAIALPTMAQDADGVEKDTRPPIAPDIREDDVKVDQVPLKLQSGNFVAVPIPISNPTLHEGLVAGAAYFYPQTEEEKKVQPASVTAMAGMYTSNDSRALGIAQQNYWGDGRWRFTGVVGGADLRLSLLASDESSLDWRIYGTFAFAKVARRLKGDWYGGLLTRLVAANQELDFEAPQGVQTNNLDTGDDARSAGLGFYLEYDSRDMPMNSYSGRHLKVNALFNDENLSSNQTYQNYDVAYRSYHTLTDSLVLAWEVQGCSRKGTAPLWDACTIKLRGFSVTDFLGSTTLSGQAEARWQFSKRWGLVGFAGAGDVSDSFSGLRDQNTIPSYGAGLRFMVLPPKRINIRVDFAWSRDSEAIHLSVGEAF